MELEHIIESLLAAGIDPQEIIELLESIPTYPES